MPGLAGALAACPLVQTRALLAEHPGAPAPVLAALYAGATTIPGGSLYPWAPYDPFENL